MVFPVPHGVTVTLERAGSSPGRDEWGQPIPGTVQEILVHGCVVTPRQQAPDVGGDQQQARDTVIVGLTLYAPPGTVVLTTDRVRVGGVRYEVTGQPGDWGVSPFTGTPSCVQVLLDRVTG